VITVCIDFGSAASYLAFEPTRALESWLGIEFDWRPIALPALPRPRPAQLGDDRGTRHRRARAEYLARDLARYAESRGLALGDVHRNPDTGLASRGLLFLRKNAPERVRAYCASVFELIWQRDADPSDPLAIGELLGATERRFFATGEQDAARELAENARELGEAGVWNAPAYLVDGDVFIGRQHLPMIAWLATGRTGEPPI